MPPRKAIIFEVNPSGLCQCGCGLPVPIATRTNSARGLFAGRPVRYCVGHQPRRQPGAIQYTVDPETGCWLFQGCLTRKGYGQLTRRGREKTHVLAHRLMYEQTRGPIPDGCELDHLCHTPRCINPDHLQPVTHRENVRRAARVRLTIEDARMIRRLASEGVRNKELASRFGIPSSHVSNIVAGNKWRE